jgi:hypothetical protein
MSTQPPCWCALVVHLHPLRFGSVHLAEEALEDGLTLPGSFESLKVYAKKLNRRFVGMECGNGCTDLYDEQ